MYEQSATSAPIQQDQLSQILGGQGTPSPLSPTPSPAGSVGSVGSQSSGYGSGELAGRGSSSQTPVAVSAAAPPQQYMLVPLNVYSTITKQNEIVGYLISYQELWEQADNIVTKGKHTGKENSGKKLFCDCNFPIYFAFVSRFLYRVG